MTDLAESAASVLDANWLGRSTKPSGHLYPHQWSWDSAFIAIGNARRGRVDRAVTELQTLFDAQWSTGMVPHMVFDQEATGYFPSAELWGTRPISAMPDSVLTSGMCQPPVHALAVRKVAAELEPSARRSFLSAMFEPLEAWHSYLHRERAIGSPLIEIWHPWEAGMDNSPNWDAALGRLHPSPEEIPVYRRVDTDETDASERPTTAEYDRYIYLLEQLRLVSYQPPDPSKLAFRICDVLFNTLMAQADAALASIAKEIGSASVEQLSDRSKSLTRAIDVELWSDDLGLYVDLDRTTGDLIEIPTAAGLLPLTLDISGERVGSLVECLRDQFVVGEAVQSGSLVPMIPVRHASFDADRYWRGPVWINVSWMLIRALESIGERALAAEMRTGVVELVQRNGCAEYFNPLTGDARGASEFSWTAALILDLLRS